MHSALVLRSPQFGPLSMNATDHIAPDEQTNDTMSAWSTGCIVAVMEKNGISARHQATLIAQICSISVSQARRKLRGSTWLFNEVLLVCRHFGLSLDAVFTPSVLQTNTWPHAGSTAPGGNGTCPASLLLLDDEALPCDIQLGPATTPQTAGLLATHHSDAWWVGSATQLDHIAPQGTRYRVEQLQLHSSSQAQRPRIAVVDDDAGAAGALTDWFNEVGYEAEAYTSPDQLTAQPLTEHDAYVVDLILAGGRTSQALVEQIRLAQPQAPIVLLTGQLRDGTASEATLATILRTQGVTFFEKPVRAAVLTAAIQSSLDRVNAQHG